MKKTTILSLGLGTLLLSGCGGQVIHHAKPGDPRYCYSIDIGLDMIEKMNATDYPSPPNAVYDGKNEIEENYLIKRAAWELYLAMKSIVDIYPSSNDQATRALTRMLNITEKLMTITPTRYADVIARAKAAALCSEDKTEQYYRFMNKTERVYLRDESKRKFLKYLE
nr:hypothetical protein [uncultured Campylobacter sp.]